MSSYLKVNEVIQVRTGDYRRKWTDAKITHVWVQPHGLSFDVEFLGEDAGLKQHVLDAFGLSAEDWRYKPAVVELEDQITEVKVKLSSGKTWFDDGKLMAAVSVSDLNELLSLAYEINNYRLNCTWNLGKASGMLNQLSHLWAGVETGNLCVDSPEYFDKMKSLMAELKGDEAE